MNTEASQTIRLQILSDLHLSMQGLEVPDVQADICILAGDVARPEAAMNWASKISCPVIYVPGNHEFYGSSIANVHTQLANFAQQFGIHLLNQKSIEIQGVRFLGTTLWTDFNLFGPELQQMAMTKCAQFMRDFKVIKNPDGSIFSPEDSINLFRQQYDWLDTKLDDEFDGPTVVITHHAPSMRSVHPRFAESVISAGFVSDCLGLLGRSNLWIHGHTHDSFDYTMYGTRVICNPRGYCKDGVNENPGFDPGFCVDIPINEPLKF